MTSFAVLDLTSNGPKRVMMHDVVQGILQALQIHGVEDIGNISNDTINRLTVQREPATAQYEPGESEVRNCAMLPNGHTWLLKNWY